MAPAKPKQMQCQELKELELQREKNERENQLAREALEKERELQKIAEHQRFVEDKLMQQQALLNESNTRSSGTAEDGKSTNEAQYNVNLNEDSIDAELENLQQLSKDTESHVSLSGIGAVNLSNPIPNTSNSNMTFTWAQVQELFKIRPVSYTHLTLPTIYSV